MIHVYVGDLAVYQDPDKFAQTLCEVDPERKKRAMKYQQELRRHQCVGAGVLLTRALACISDTGKTIGKTTGKTTGDQERPEIRHDRNGKPYLKNREGVFFNLSHSQGFAACAIGDREVGVDIQSIRPYHEKAARRAFSSEEMAVIVAADEREKDYWYSVLWAQKESIWKLKGSGMEFHASDREKETPEPVRTRSWMFEREGLMYALAVSTFEGELPTEWEEIPL